MPRTYRLVDGSDAVYFNSGASMPLCLLSNFAACEFEWGGFQWTSSEHAYQAWRHLDESHWPLFASGGAYASLETGLPLIFRATELEKKQRYYGAKAGGRPAMVGIVAKMAIKPDVALRNGLPLKDLDPAQSTDEAATAVFEEILLAKYGNNKANREALLATKGKRLIEFSRGAESEAKRGAPPRWTGLVTREGVVVGHNLQGRIHERVRDLL